MIRLLQAIEGAMHPAAAPIKIAARLRRQQMIVGLHDERTDFVGVRQLVGLRVEFFLHLPVVSAGVFEFVPALLLQKRTGPLREVAAPMMLGVPRAAMHLHLLRRREAPQVFADVNGREPQRPGAVTIQDRLVEKAPEAGLDLRRAKPAAVLAVGPRGHERGEIAVLGALMDFVLKPAGVEAGKLRVGKIAVARHDDDFRATEPREIRTIAGFFPAHLALGLDIDGIHEHVFETVPREHRNHFHAETHLRRPETVEVIAPQLRATEAFPPIRLRVPIGGRRERIHGMIQTAADVFDVRAAEAVHEVGDVDGIGESFAKAGVFELLEERAGKAQVQARHVPILIEHPRDAVVAPKDLLGFPRLGGIVERHQIA